MRPNIFAWVMVIAGLLCADTTRASVWFSSAPSSVQSGTGYYVEASASGGSFDLTIYKNSGYFCGTSGSGWASTGSSTSDTGAQTVEYRAETYDWYTMDYDNTYAWVSITVNNTPTITWINAPSSAYVGQWFNVQARGNDSDGNLSFVRVWKDDSPFAFNDGGNGYEKYSDNNAAQGTSAGTITFKAKSGDSASAESSYIYHYVSIIKYDQTISFGHPGTQTYGSNLGLSASASSGLGVSFSVLSGPAYLSGNTLVFTGAGSVTVRASQGGNGTYNAAPNVDHTITVNPASQTITFAQPGTQTYGSNLGLSASASSGLGVSFAVLSGPAYLSGNTLVFTAGGSVTVRASQAGNANYYAAANVDRTITVNKANQTITFNQPSAQTYGGQLALGATASSGLTVSYSVISGNASISYGTITFQAAGSVTVRASQAGNGGYNAAPDVDRTITVNPASQTITFTQPGTQTYGSNLGLSASASSGLGVSFAVLSGPAYLSGNTLVFTAGGSVTVRASQAGNANYYAAANVDRTITVNKADQTITFAQPAAQTYGGELALGATASSGLTVSYSVISGTASISYGTITFQAAGSVTVRASQAGNGGYNAAPDVDRTITVNKANQTITFNQPAAQTYGGQLTLDASASSGLGVVYTVQSGPASLAGNVLTFTGAGNVVVRASQAGNANINAAPDVDRTITVNKANQTITFNQPSAQIYGGQLALTASATSGLGVSFAVVSGPASLAGSTLTFTDAGSVVVRASQAGNANYNAAANVDRTITVNKATPSGAFASPRRLGVQTLTTYTVQAGDLNATFTGPAGAAAPTGTVTYTQVGPGTAVITGTVLNLGTYTIRANYPGDARYNATTTDATWIVTLDADEDGVDDYLEDQLGTDRNGGASDTEADTANQTKLQIHRPAP